MPLLAYLTKVIHIRGPHHGRGLFEPTVKNHLRDTPIWICLTIAPAVSHYSGTRFLINLPAVEIEGRCNLERVGAIYYGNIQRNDGKASTREQRRESRGLASEAAKLPTLSPWLWRKTTVCVYAMSREIWWWMGCSRLPWLRMGTRFRSQD